MSFTEKAGSVSMTRLNLEHLVAGLPPQEAIAPRRREEAPAEAKQPTFRDQFDRAARREPSPPSREATPSTAGSGPPDRPNHSEQNPDRESNQRDQQRHERDRENSPDRAQETQPAAQSPPKKKSSEDSNPDDPTGPPKEARSTSLDAAIQDIPEQAAGRPDASDSSNDASDHSVDANGVQPSQPAVARKTAPGKARSSVPGETPDPARDTAPPSRSDDGSTTGKDEKPPANGPTVQQRGQTVTEIPEDTTKIPEDATNQEKTAPANSGQPTKPDHGGETNSNPGGEPNTNGGVAASLSETPLSAAGSQAAAETEHGNSSQKREKRGSSKRHAATRSQARPPGEPASTTSNNTAPTPTVASPVSADASTSGDQPGKHNVSLPTTGPAESSSSPQDADPPRSPSGGEATSNPVDKSPSRLDPTTTTKTIENHGPNQVQRARLVRRVAGALRLAGQRGGELRLRLSPPELGSLRLHVTLKNGTLNARIEAQSHAARSLLLDSLPVLRERLSGQGVKIERFDVDLMDQSPSDSPGPQDHHPPSDDPSSRPPATVSIRQRQEIHERNPDAGQQEPDSQHQLNVII